MRTSIYNMLNNSWKSIRLVSQEQGYEPIYRFGSAVIPIFDKHVAIREQKEMVTKVAPRASGPVPLAKLLIVGGISLDEQVQKAALTGQATFSDKLSCTVLNFTNSNQAPCIDSSNTDAAKK